METFVKGLQALPEPHGAQRHPRRQRAAVARHVPRDVLVDLVAVRVRRAQEPLPHVVLEPARDVEELRHHQPVPEPRVRGDDIRREEERHHPHGAGRRLARGRAHEVGVREPPPLRGDAAVARGAVQRDTAHFMTDNSFPAASAEDGLLGNGMRND